MIILLITKKDKYITLNCFNVDKLLKFNFEGIPIEKVRLGDVNDRYVYKRTTKKKYASHPF
jgi:hypothetical protein